MKHIYVIAGLVAASVAPMAAQASDGSIAFKGALQTSTCSVTAAASNANQTITLPTLDISVLPAAAATAGDTPFQIQTTGSTACTKTAATAYFENNANVDTSTGRLKTVAGTGAATNVQLQLLNKSGSVIDLSKATGSQGVTSAALTGGASTSEFVVRYYATGATSAGSVNSNINFSMVYN